MKETNNFVFDSSLKKDIFYTSTNTINEDSIMEAIQACGGSDEYHWKPEKHLILVNKGFVVVHCITSHNLSIQL